MLSPTEFERMLVEDSRQRALHDDVALRLRGIVQAERKFNPAEPRDPHSGKWTDGPGGAAKAVGKALGKMTEDAFFEAHGDDWHDQYGSPDTVEAILWSTGTASLYRSTGKSRVHAFGDVDAPAARRLSADVKWASGHPDTGTPGSMVGHREVDLGALTAQIGAGYDADGDLFVRLTMPPVGKDKQPTVIDMVDLDQVEALAGDLDKLAADLDSKAYENARSQTPARRSRSGIRA